MDLISSSWMFVQNSQYLKGACATKSIQADPWLLSGSLEDGVKTVLKYFFKIRCVNDASVSPLSCSTLKALLNYGAQQQHMCSAGECPQLEPDFSDRLRF